MATHILDCFPKPARMPLGRNNYYRMRLLPQAQRFVVERFDDREGHWLAVHIDDSAHRAFNEMIRIVRAAHGITVCASCEIMMPAPALRDNRVVCPTCFVSPRLSERARIRALMAWAVIAAAVTCAISIAWSIAHAGVR